MEETKEVRMPTGEEIAEALNQVTDFTKHCTSGEGFRDYPDPLWREALGDSHLQFFILGLLARGSLADDSELSGFMSTVVSLHALDPDALRQAVKAGYPND